MRSPHHVFKGWVLIPIFSEVCYVGGRSCPRAVLVTALRVSQYSDVLGTADFRVDLAFLGGDTP